MKTIIYSLLLSTIVLATPPERPSTATTTHTHQTGGQRGNPHSSHLSNDPRFVPHTHTELSERPQSAQGPSANFMAFHFAANPSEAVIHPHWTVLEVTLVKSNEAMYQPHGAYIEVRYRDGAGEKTLSLRYGNTIFLTRPDMRLTPAQLATLPDRTVLSRPRENPRTQPNPRSVEALAENPRVLVGVLARELAEPTSNIPEAINNPTLQAHLRNADLIRSVRFEKRGGEIAAIIEHAALPGRSLEITGTDRLALLFRHAGIQMSPQFLYANFPMFWLSSPNLRALPSLGDRIYSSAQVSEVTHRHRTTPSEQRQNTDAQGNFDTTHRTTINVDPATGLPSPRGTAIPIVVQVRGQNLPTSQVWTSNSSDPRYLALSPQARANFEFYLLQMRR